MNESDQLIVRPGRPLCGDLPVPGDKSISHRALLLSALAGGASRVENFLPSGDCLASLNCLRALGIPVDSHSATTLTIHGRGLSGLTPSDRPLDCVRSGTTMRLLAGILSGQSFTTTLTGDPQLLRRPMRRIVDPLRRIGAEINDSDGCAPLVIHGACLRSYNHKLEIASAQVKSALLLAGLYADGPTVVRQPAPARDHTERMLSAMGASIETAGLTVTLHPSTALSPLSLSIPGDISSAAFLLVAAILVPNSRITLMDVGTNPTRTGLLDVLERMGARIGLENERQGGNEPASDLGVNSSELQGTEVGGETVVRMIDEFPVLAVAATQARGATVVRDAAELRVKETDRIATTVAELRKMGAQIKAMPDGFVVQGPTPLRGAVVHSHGDHRLAMALAVAGLVADGETVVNGFGSVSDSFPGFETALNSLAAG